MRTALKVLRLKNGLNQTQMAKKLGYSRNHYQRIETGEQEVTLKGLVALSEGFGMSLEKARNIVKRDDE